MANIRNSKKDLKDRLGALMIYLELKDCTDEKTFISSIDMTKRLEERYGKENAPSHNTVAKYLKAMKDYSEELEIDVRKGNSKQGYCLADREFSEYEIQIFVDAVVNSKSLNEIDKKEIIDKCYRHLGMTDEEQIQRIYDYLFSQNKNRNKVNNKKLDATNFLEKINKAIKNKQIVKLYFPLLTSGKVGYTIAHPYRIFNYENNIYLMYGIVHKKNKIMKSHIMTYKNINNFTNVEQINNSYVEPIENYTGFESGINEDKFRRDPFGCIKGNKEKPVMVEILSFHALQIREIKSEMISTFGNDVEFLRKGDREIAYINSNNKKCMSFLFEYSDVCIVVGPEGWKRRFKSKILSTYLKYKPHKKNVEKKLSFIDSDDYIEVAHQRLEANKEFYKKKHKEKHNSTRQK